MAFAEKANLAESARHYDYKTQTTDTDKWAGPDTMDSLGSLFRVALNDDMGLIT